jgi:sialidase-1
MYRKIIFLLLFTSFYKYSMAQTANRWKGYERVDVTIAGHQAYYVKPAKALPGRPWVWRSSFPDWHTEMDSLLLSKGMYIAYINADDQYGSPAALQVWDSFYNYLTDSEGMSAKPALEAVSRGALYALGWAKRNPDKVSCIYAETPVYDIKSWPGGKGKGPGDAAAWKQLKDVYHFTEAQAIAFDDNPVDHLEGLASFKIPVFNVIGINDQLAPREENTDIFVSRYTALGGPVTISPVTEGPQEMQGHHFPVKHAASYADFILENSYPVKKVLPYSPYINTRSGLSHFYRKALISKQANVAFLGGSITYNPGWRQKVCMYLKERFPETQFHFIAAGIPSLGSLAHTFRLKQDVLDSGRIDLMFVEAAVNDRGSGVDSITQLRSLEGIIRHAKKSNPVMDIIMMEFADTYKSNDYNKGVVPEEIARHEAVASHYQLPSINQAKAVAEKINNGEFTWKDDFGDIHPAPYGQELYFAMIKELFKTCFAGQPLNPGTPQRLPAPLDKANFERGHYYSISNAVYDKGWTMNPGWTAANGQSTREGFVNVPMLTTEKEGAVLTLPFSGNVIGMAIISGNDAGIISYQIDKGPARTLDLFTEWSSSLHLPYYICLGSDLKKGKHTLTIKMLNDKNTGSKGHACRIVHFLVNDN